MKRTLISAAIAASFFGSSVYAAEAPPFTVEEAYGNVRAQLNAAGFTQGKGTSVNTYTDNFTVMNVDTPEQRNTARANSATGGSATSNQSDGRANFFSSVQTDVTVDIFNVTPFFRFDRKSATTNANTSVSAQNGGSASGFASGNTSIEHNRR